MSHENEKGISADQASDYSQDLDLSLLHEARAGRLVVDPEEARIEFGAKAASRLKLNHDGTKVLWPQPGDSPLDPQNVRANVSISAKTDQVHAVEPFQEELSSANHNSCCHCTRF
jgi:hypothetical protein